MPSLTQQGFQQRLMTLKTLIAIFRCFLHKSSIQKELRFSRKSKSHKIDNSIEHSSSYNCSISFKIIIQAIVYIIYNLMNVC